MKKNSVHRIFFLSEKITLYCKGMLENNVYKSRYSRSLEDISPLCESYLTSMDIMQLAEYMQTFFVDVE